MGRNVPCTGYDVEVENIGKERWSDLLLQFDDATIYQTWSLGEVHRGGNNLSHMVLLKHGEVVGLCQIVIKKFPMVNTGVADVYSGPLWRKRGGDLNVENFHHMIRFLKDEYALNRGLLLRIWPNEFEYSKYEFVMILETLGFQRNTSEPPQRTLLLDVSSSLEVLRKNLSKTWRLHLNRAEKSKLKVIEGSSDPLYERFLVEMEEMVVRKRFVPKINYDKYRIIQKELPENLKMKILACEFESKPVCTIICSAMGDTGIYFFGATANEGLKTNASNLLHWRMIQWLKENGYRWYDLGGINPKESPGTYQFKRGLAGSLGEDRIKIGQFYFCGTLKGHFLSTLMKRVIPLRDRVRAMRSSPNQ